MPRKKSKAVKQILEYEELNIDVEEEELNIDVEKESEPPKAREKSKKIRAPRISRKIAPKIVQTAPDDPPDQIVRTPSKLKRVASPTKEVVPPTPDKVKRLAHYVFTFKQEQELIQFYQDNPMLWDRNSNEYRKMKQKDRDEIYKNQAVQYADCTGKL